MATRSNTQRQQEATQSMRLANLVILSFAWNMTTFRLRPTNHIQKMLQGFYVMVLSMCRLSKSKSLI